MWLYLEQGSVPKDALGSNEGAPGLSCTFACLRVCAEIVWKCREYGNDHCKGRVKFKFEKAIPNLKKRKELIKCCRKPS
jgi:hypothetical protein